MSAIGPKRRVIKKPKPRIPGKPIEVPNWPTRKKPHTAPIEVPNWPVPVKVPAQPTK